MLPHPAIELRDVQRAQSLFVMPTRGHAPAVAQSAGARLAPIEMLASSLHLNPKAPPPVIPSIGNATRPLLPLLAPLDHHHSAALLAHLWAVPAGYALCGLWTCTCSLMAPGYIHVCGHLLCPVLTLVLALHAAAFLALDGPVWAWGGVLVATLFPFVVQLSHAGSTFAYFLVFAAFASGRFWQNLHGAAFLAVGMCWFGLLSACVLSSFMEDHHRVQLGVVGFFAVAAAFVSSWFTLHKLALRVSASPHY
jgi:hypothetical protein